MRRGRPSKPIISIESINAALKSLDFSVQSSPEIQALENLLLIDFRLRNSARPSAEDIRAWMLRKILVEWICTALNQHRRFFDLAPASLGSSREIVMRQLEQDFQTDSEHLKGWSLFYVRYVRPELDFSVQELAKRTSTTARTLQRYQEKIVYLLRDKLIEAEWEVRKTQQKNSLKSSIPEQIVPLIGRESEFKSILSCFQSDFLRPIAISGKHGIGKSALAASIADYLVEHSTIDYLVWIKQAQQISYIPNKIWDTVLPYPTQQHWREVLAYQQLLIVIDGVDALDMMSDEWGELLVHLRKAYVLITAVEKPIMAHSIQHIVLGDLSQMDASELIGSYNQLDVVSTQEIVSQIGGNPRNLIRAAQMASASQATVLDNYFDAIHDTLSDKEEALQVLAVINQESIADNLVEFVLQEDTQTFRMKALPEMSNAYSDFIYDLYKSDNHIRESVWKYIKEIAASTTNDSFILKVLASEWLQLDKALIQELLERVDLQNSSIGDVHLWRYLYQRHFGLQTKSSEEGYYLGYQYGIALRRANLHDEAESHLDSLTHELGQRGQFELQLRVFYQLGLLSQAQGQFAKAQDIYTHISRLLETYSLPDLKHDTCIQLARIEIARQHGEVALQYLDGLDLDDSNVFALYCEAQFLLSEWGFLSTTIPAMLQQRELPSKLRASLHTILGRVYLQSKDYEAAIIEFNEALSLAERDANAFDTARAQNNLGSAYLMTIDEQAREFLEEVEELLLTTQELQIQIRDAVGLEASTRNLIYLGQHKATRGGQ